MARQSGRTVRAILGAGADVLSSVELWFWEGYDILEPIGSDTLQLSKIIAALMADESPHKFMPYRYRNRNLGELGSYQHQLQLACMLEAFANSVRNL